MTAKTDVKETNILTQDIIDKLKEENPSGIYKTTIEDKVFVWRQLLRTEYVEIINQPDIDTFRKEEIITITCVVWPKITEADLKSLGAGVPTTLSENILSKSGFEATTVEKL